MLSIATLRKGTYEQQPEKKIINSYAECRDAIHTLIVHESIGQPIYYFHCVMLSVYN
jgi:hypothetical protein